MQATTTAAIADIPVQRTTSPRPRPPEDALGFGKVFTDHMFLMEYDLARGWHGARIGPYGALALDPAAAVLHYGQEVFDGLKAFRGRDGTVRVFRAEAHVRRLERSCERLCIPPPPAELVARSFEALLRVDRDWVPASAGTALYLRPTIIATEPFIGVRPATEFLCYLIATPVGAYFAGGMRPVKIWVDDVHVRAVPGGLGGAKTSANYAASFHAAEQARQRGFDQVLWLDGAEHRYLDEVGTMNIMVRIGDTVLTPPLNGAILPGVTRDAVLALLRDWGIPVQERRIAFEEVLGAARDGSLREIWGTGTAAVVLPVGELGWRDGRIEVNGGKPGELAGRLYGAITGIQYGEQPDPHGWMTDVD